MADKQILMAKLDGYKKQANEWLNTEVYGYTRRKIVTTALVLGFILLTAF